jgi:drug/metabolite transporter (DMT)-like permease
LDEVNASGKFRRWLLLGEGIPPNRWIGAGIIVAGAFVIGLK